MKKAEWAGGNPGVSPHYTGPGFARAGPRFWLGDLVTEDGAGNRIYCGKRKGAIPWL